MGSEMCIRDRYTVYFTKKDFKVLANAGSVVIEFSELKLKLSSENREWWKIAHQPLQPTFKIIEEIGLSRKGN